MIDAPKDLHALVAWHYRQVNTWAPRPCLRMKKANAQPSDPCDKLIFYKHKEGTITYRVQGVAFIDLDFIGQRIDFDADGFEMDVQGHRLRFEYLP